jgi:hypothetical protein
VHPQVLVAGGSPARQTCVPPASTQWKPLGQLDVSQIAVHTPLLKHTLLRQSEGIVHAPPMGLPSCRQWSPVSVA